MKKLTCSIVLASIVACSSQASNFDLSLSGSDKGISGFSLSVGEYYKAPAEEIKIIKRSLSEDELSVAYFLARKSGKNADYIAKLKTDGKNWWDITLSLGLKPEVIYVVETKKHKGPPHGKAYGYYKKGQKLKDAEVVEVVNAKFFASKYGVSEDEAIEYRRGGKAYADMDNDFRGKKHKKEKGHGKGRDDDDDRPGKGHGKGRD